VEFILPRLYQNVSEVIHERDKARRNFDVALFVQPLAQLHEFIVNP
jgi:hypothetical protein